MKIKATLAAVLTTASFCVFAQMPVTPAMPADRAASPDDKLMKLDKNKDGVISKKEASSDMQKHWDQWDSNHDGVIDASEYALGATSKPGDSAAPSSY